MTVQLVFVEPRVELIFDDEDVSLASGVDADTVLGVVPGPVGLELLAADDEGEVAALVFPAADDVVVIKGSGDATKESRFEVDGHTTGNLRVHTLADADGKLAQSAAALTDARLPKGTSAAGVIADSGIADGTTSGGVLTLAAAASYTITYVATGTGLVGTLTNANRILSVSAAGVAKESLVQDGVSSGALTLAKDGTTAQTATFPDLASQKVAASAAALTNARLPKGTSTSGVIADSGIADGTSGGGVLTLAASASYTLTVPATGTAGLLGAAQTWSALNTFSSGVVMALGSAGSPSIAATGGTTTGIAFTTTAVLFSISGTEAGRFDSNRVLVVSTNGASLATFIAGASRPSLQVIGTSTLTASMGIALFSASTAGARISGAHSRGTTVGDYTAISSGDNCLELRGEGSDGSGFQRAAQISILCDGTASAGIVPGRIDLFTTDSGGTSQSRLRLDSGGGAQIRSSMSSTSPGSGQLLVRGLATDQQTVSSTGNILSIPTDTGLVLMTGAAPVIQSAKAPTLGSTIVRYRAANATQVNHQDAAGTASERIITKTGANVPVAAGDFFRLIYDSSAARWYLEY